MRPLSAPELLGVWESGLVKEPVERALTLVAAAEPGSTPDAVAELNVGQRDARLLTLRKWAFGAQMVGLVTCPACGDDAELSFNVEKVGPAPDLDRTTPQGTLSLDMGGYEVSFRVPNSRDIKALADAPDGTDPERRLFDRCLVAVQENGETRAKHELPAAIVDAATELMAEADPMADLSVAVSCPSCGHDWQETFDIVSFFWSEIDAWARRLLRDVHSLASAYGWTQREILALSPTRRQSYLEMIG